MLGGLKKMAEQSEKNQNSESKPQRAIIMTTSIEMLKLTTGRRCGVRRGACGFQGDEVVTSSWP